MSQQKTPLAFLVRNIWVLITNNRENKTGISSCLAGHQDRVRTCLNILIHLQVLQDPTPALSQGTATNAAFGATPTEISLEIILEIILEKYLGKCVVCVSSSPQINYWHPICNVWLWEMS